MKAILAALVAMVLIGAGSYAVLNNNFQMSAEKAYSTTGARPGH
jgi:Flp pilus assembly pilin Flp